MTERVELRLVEGERFQTGYLTGLARPGIPLRQAAQELFTELASIMAEHEIEPVQEKVYGRVDARKEVLAIRQAALAAAGLDPNLPCTFHQGKPIEREDFAGVQLWGIVPRNSKTTVTTIGNARCWKGRDFRLLYVPGIYGLQPDGRLGDGPIEQAERMFLNAEAVLRDNGYSFKNVRRTWIYLKRILDWYDEFNRVRTSFFTERDVGMDAERSFPSSTGIQGATAGEECSMDLVAIDGSGVVITPIHGSSKQKRSFNYGSAFSRAMSVQIGGLDTVFVSGTASIDTSGATVHLDDPEAQVRETLQCIEALLVPRGGGLQDIHLATLFCKTPEIMHAYQKVVGQPGMAALPAVPVVADMCRPELLVEIEAIAALAAPHDAS